MIANTGERTFTARVVVAIEALINGTVRSSCALLAGGPLFVTAGAMDREAESVAEVFSTPRLSYIPTQVEFNRY